MDRIAAPATLTLAMPATSPEADRLNDAQLAGHQ